MRVTHQHVQPHIGKMHYEVVACYGEKYASDGLAVTEQLHIQLVII